MAKLKLSAVPEDRPVKLTVELPATVHRDLVTYADLLARESGQKIEPAKLVAPMLARFISSICTCTARRERHKLSEPFIELPPATMSLSSLYWQRLTPIQG
jgi:hypothetical protein